MLYDYNMEAMKEKIVGGRDLDVQLGNTMVFLRTNKMYQLEQAILDRHNEAATIIQSQWRGKEEYYYEALKDFIC